MSFEKPVSLRKNPKHVHLDATLECVIHNNNLSGDECVEVFTNISWNKVCKTKTYFLGSNDPNQIIFNIASQVPSTLDPTCHGFHKNCYSFFTHKRNKCKKV